MRPGGRENWGIKIIETAGKTLENVLVKADPFHGNKCLDKTCLPNKNPKNKISCRKNNVGYKISCKLCPGAYLGETGENMHTRAKSHLTKFNSKSQQLREGSAFYKHIQNKHGGLKDGESFEDYFEIEIVKSYRKPLTRIIEEGTFIINHEGEVLNSKNEWHQPKIIRTTITQGGAELAGGEVRRTASVMCVETAPAAAASNPSVMSVETAPAAAASQENTGRATRARTRANRGT